MGIQLYDTVKDGKGNRFRVVEVSSDGNGHVIASLRGLEADGRVKRGQARKVEASILEKEYTRVDLPPVEVVRPANKPEPHEKVAEIERQAVRELSTKDIKAAVDSSTYGSKKTECVQKTAASFESLEWKVRTLAKEKNDAQQEIAMLEDEVADLRKSISEKDNRIALLEKSVQDLKDINAEIGEEKAALKRAAQLAGQRIDKLQKENEVLISTADSLASAVRVISELMDAAREAKDNG